MDLPFSLANVPAQETRSQPGEVILRQSAASESGFGAHVQVLTRALNRHGWRVRNELTAAEIGLNEMDSDASHSLFLQFGPPSGFDLYRRCHRRVGYCAAPADFIPGSWLEACSSLDALWLPSLRQVELFAAAGIDRDRLHALPRGIDPDLFHPDVPAPRLGRQAAVQILTFWEPTPDLGSDLAVHAFLQEFTVDDPVALLLHAPKFDEDDAALLCSLIERSFPGPAGRTPQVIVHVGKSESMERAGLYTLADVVLVPCRADLSGPICLEAMSCGRPVIATQWGEAQDLAGDDHGYLVANRALAPVPASAGDEACMGGRWADPDMDDLRRTLRLIASHPEETRRCGARAREWVLDHHSGEGWQQRWLTAIQSQMPTRSGAPCP